MWGWLRFGAHLLSPLNCLWECESHVRTERGEFILKGAPSLDMPAAGL